MAEIKIITLDAEGFECEHDPDVDTLTIAGLSMNGDLAMGSNNITGLADGIGANDAVNMQQLQAVQDNVSYKKAARLKSLVDLGATFNAAGGVDSLGQFTVAPTTIDGIAIAAGDRILVANQTLGAENGIYEVTAVTTVWDRASDFNETAEVIDGSTVWVGEGATCADTRWTQTTNGPLTVNTTAQVWVQTAGSGSLVGGNGIDITGSTVSVDLSAIPGLQFNAGLLEVLANPTGGIEVVAAGIGVLVDPAGPLSVGAAGTTVLVDGVTMGINGSNQLEVLGAGKAETIGKEYTVAAGGVTIGDPVYLNASGEIASALGSNNTQSKRVFGIAQATTAAAATTCVLSEGVSSAASLTGATPGEPVYLDPVGGLTQTVPVAPNNIVLIGYADTATTLYIKTEYKGKKRA